MIEDCQAIALKLTLRSLLQYVNTIHRLAHLCWSGPNPKQAKRDRLQRGCLAVCISLAESLQVGYEVQSLVRFLKVAEDHFGPFDERFRIFEMRL